MRLDKELIRFIHSKIKLELMSKTPPTLIASSIFCRDLLFIALCHIVTS